MNKSKDWGVLEIHGTATKFGGASNGTKILMEELTREGLKMVICYNKGNEVLNGINKYYSSLPLELSTKNPLKFLKNLDSLIQFVKGNNIKVIHSHHRNDNIYACFLKIFNPKLKILYTAHGTSIVNQESILIYKIIRWLNIWLINRFVDTVVYISGYTKKKVSPYYLKVKKHHIIHNGTPKPEVEFSRNEIREEIGLEEEDFMVSIIGDIGGVKRPEVVLEIAEKLRSNEKVKFVFIGDGEKKAQIKRIAGDKELNVKFVSSTLSIGSYIKASDLIISTALEEGFGRTLIEAMGWEKPVIAFNSGGPKEIIDHGRSGFLIERDCIDDYADKIKFLLNNKKYALDFGECGYKKYELEFTERIYARNYWRLILKEVKKFEKLGTKHEN